MLMGFLQYFSFPSVPKSTLRDDDAPIQYLLLFISLLLLSPEGFLLCTNVNDAL